MSTKELKEQVIKAVKLFIKNDKDLLRLKVYEPAISHRIAFYLERDSFHLGFHVDCEYNKRLDNNKPGLEAKYMRPDIVIHTRNNNDNNILAIEIKKKSKSLYDEEKLKLLTKKNGLFGYNFGVFIYFPKDEPKYKWFVDGNEWNEEHSGIFEAEFSGIGLYK